jgi:Dyp-type peroxidase family
MSARVEVEEVQSLVLSGHARLPATLALGLTLRDVAEARRSLRELAETEISFGFGEKTRTQAVQLALTARGLKVLGATTGDLAMFSRQFQQGMVAPQRSRALGDANQNAPAGWGWSDRDLHAMVLIYASDSAVLEAATAGMLRRIGGGWTPTLRFPIHLPKDGREPFGFADGLSSTRVDIGDGRASEPGVALLPPGEVVLGYETAGGVVQPVPPIAVNGSYLVLRQLEQDVKAFWEFWSSQARSAEEAVWLAAKAVGRWPNGMPVSGSAPGPEPAFDEAVALAPFQFSSDDRGLKCPFGAHVRRANPRDGLGDDPQRSLEIVRHHRMLRRGRVYGPPAPAEWYPPVVRGAKEVGAAADAASSRGLLFMSLCGDISRQFEFVQQTWLNNPKFLDLYDEVDPIAAGHGIPADSHRFSIPRAPLRHRVNGIERWVRVRGGGYFLLPGRSALLQFLAS